MNTNTLVFQLAGHEFTFKNELDIGHFLTFLTLIAGFIWWLYTTNRSLRDKTTEDAKSGALRLLLRILREQHGVPCSLRRLHEAFSSPAMKERRKAYCKRDWRFKDEATFEAAVYRLDWEGKIDFVSPDEIVFRVDRVNREDRDLSEFVPSEADKKRMLEIFVAALKDTRADTWELEKLARGCMRVSPAETSEAIRDVINGSDTGLHRRAASILDKFIADKPSQRKS